MNEKRRKSLREALALLGRAESIVDQICDQEMDAMENYPENLQGTDTYESMENAVDSLEEATEKIEEAKEHLEQAMKG